MKINIRNKVHTPIGDGVVSGKFVIQAADAAICAVIVRVKVDEQTRPHLQDANCMTPKAEESGLWSFAEEQLQAA